MGHRQCCPRALGLRGWTGPPSLALTAHSPPLPRLGALDPSSRGPGGWRGLHPGLSRQPRLPTLSSIAQKILSQTPAGSPDGGLSTPVRCGAGGLEQGLGREPQCKAHKGGRLGGFVGTQAPLRLSRRAEMYSHQALEGWRGLPRHSLPCLLAQVTPLWPRETATPDSQVSTLFTHHRGWCV